jgi:carboxymethylenebutenolidase
MMIETSSVDVRLSMSAGAGVVRCAVARPTTPGPHPLLLCFADIFGHTPSHLRVLQRFAGHGFVVVSPEPWAAFHPPGTVFDFDRDRDAALAAQARADVAHEDSARAAVVAHFRAQPGVTDAIFALGFCYGGHCALRAALDTTTRATACFYPTGVHSDRLGEAPSPTLARAAEIHGELLLMWGRKDPHIPAAGRARIHAALDAAGVRWEARLFDAEHAFARDVGPRFDPAATDAAFRAALALFARAMQNA